MQARPYNRQVTTPARPRVDARIPLLATAIGGMDEAGRGPLAGPVVAAVVLLAPNQSIHGVRDSKQLSAAQREQLVPRIESEAIDWAVGQASAEEIDQLNILQATFLAMRRAVESLRQLPGILRVDGNQPPALPDFPGSVELLVGGDRLCPAIGAASILAKVRRDRDMERLDLAFPGYGFARHKGYPTALHRQALIDLGPCPEHRRSFRPVRMALAASSQDPG